MLSRFNPNAVKQAVKAAASRALDRFKDDRLGQRPVDWFAAAVATGAAKEYRLGFRRLPDAWKEPTDQDIVEAIKDSLTKVCAAESEDAATLSEWTHAVPSARRDAARAFAVAVATLENRTALHLAMHGLQYALDVRHRIRMTSVADENAKESCALSAPDSAIDSAIMAFAEKLSTLDEQLHRKMIALSSAAHTDSLVAMRSLMRPNDFLPWWLDGTLETVAAAQTVGGEKRAMLNAVLERDPANDDFLKMLVPAIDGPLATIGQPTNRIDVHGSRRDVYAWNLPDGEGGSPTRIELVAPSPGGQGMVLELRVAEPVGAASNCGPASGDEGEPEGLRPDYAVMDGRAMLLNGIVFLWFRSGRRVTAKVTMGSPPLPLRGQMQLFDCSTSRVLEPVQPA